ncbi:hypothetical protein SAMN05421734_106150 [Pelagirhabdus alkalitolerans]|uniref:Zinc-ribbon containing domain-containing protein n=1 Tax=Pelagirhabdus alkalitolerans TaxID=1612202 RepID=A0A1G6KQD2_9BACI|nr:hypothetical protein [Pelagirhabdus alkalitolerans]SDC32546.1 hypothetical protein SAMN05421734_106150 [Pelagirhabdus alkalitolerans]
MPFVAGVIFLIAGFALWLFFKYTLIVLNQLGRGLGQNQNFQNHRSEKVVICSTCGSKVYSKQGSAYCDHCRQYI